MKRVGASGIKIYCKSATKKWENRYEELHIREINRKSALQRTL